MYAKGRYFTFDDDSYPEERCLELTLIGFESESAEGDEQWICACILTFLFKVH